MSNSQMIATPNNLPNGIHMTSHDMSSQSTTMFLAEIRILVGFVIPSKKKNAEKPWWNGGIKSRIWFETMGV